MTAAFTSAVDAAAARRVGIVGAGVIGGGWALHYLRTGFDVDVYDPAPAARTDLLRMVEASWPLLDRIGLREGASPDRLTCHDTLAAAVAHADLVQENAPENGPVKQRVLAEADRAARPGVVIASSTSGFAMTMLQADCEHPERCVVGHPFNPPYLIPVVEVVGGERTDPAAVDWLVRFYASTGKRPLRLSRAQMGPCLTFHLAGGGGGMAHMLDHFGAALEEPWTRLQAPPLTPELRDRMIEGCLREADGRSVAELEQLRDGFLAELLELVERYTVAAGGKQSAEPATPVVAVVGSGPTAAVVGSNVILDTLLGPSLPSA